MGYSLHSVSTHIEQVSRGRPVDPPWNSVRLPAAVSRRLRAAFYGCRV